MPRPQEPERPKNRETENEELRVPAQEGQPPRPATEPPGTGWSTRSSKTLTDPGSGAPIEETPAGGRGKRPH